MKSPGDAMIQSERSNWKQIPGLIHRTEKNGDWYIYP